MAFTVNESFEIRRAKAQGRRALRDRWETAENALRPGLLSEFLELDPDFCVELSLGILEDPYRPLRERAFQTLHTLAKSAGSTGAESLGTGSDEIFSELCYRAMNESSSLTTLSLLFHLLLEAGGSGVLRAFDYFRMHPGRQRELVDLAKGYSPLERLRLFIPFALAPRHVKRKTAPVLEPLLRMEAAASDVVDFLFELRKSAPYGLAEVRALCGDYFDDLMAASRLREYVMGRMATLLPGAATLNAVGALAWFTEDGLPLELFDLLAEGVPGPLKAMACEVIQGAGPVWMAKGRDALLQGAQGDDDSVLDVFPLMARVWDAQTVSKVLVSLMGRWDDEKGSLLRDRLWWVLAQLEAVKLGGVLKHLPPENARVAIRGMAKALVAMGGDVAASVFSFYQSGQTPGMQRASELFLQARQASRDAARELILKETDPGSCEEAVETRGFFGSLMERPHIRRFKRDPLGDLFGESFVGNIFSSQDFSGQVFKGGDFSGAIFIEVNFSEARFEGGDFRFASFESCSFQGAGFTECFFDGAVFRRCALEKAELLRCGLSRARLYETNAFQSRIRDCSLSNARIIHSSFAGAVLRQARMAGTLIAACDFTDSHFYDTSFTRAKWQMNNLARMHCDQGQGPISDDPVMGDHFLDESLFSAEQLASRWLNLLHLAQEMTRQRRAFLRFNQRRLALCQDSLKERQEELFELIPLLIHDPTLPVPGEPEGAEGAPAGIFGFDPSESLFDLAESHLGVVPEVSFSEESYDGLYTIGSSGSVAQTTSSDIDYWLCLGEKGGTPDALKRLAHRLEAIEAWVLSGYGLEIHFFVMEPEAIRENRFGGSDKESSGSAQGLILKEEFYRTFQVVAGKLPFWCVTPPEMRSFYYEPLFSVASGVWCDCIDLGEVKEIPDGEYFGASIWQLFKSFFSPFKSVLKMALLERTISGEEKGRLLCDVLKSRWSTGGWGGVGEDPYLLLYETLKLFYGEGRNEEEASIVRLSFLQKLGGSVVARERSLFRMRASLLKRFLAKIGQEGLWLQQLEGKVGRGAGERVEVLAESINTFMITTYQRLSQHLKDAGQGSSHITDRDLTVLGRRMVVHYAAMEGKLMKRDLVSQRQVTFKQLSYAWRSRRKQTGTWELYGGTPPAAIPYGARGALFAMEPYVESVVVQAVLNGYYHPGVLVKMFPNPTQVSLRDIIRLMEVLLERFPQGEEFTISSEDLLEGEKVRRAILIVGLDSPMLTGAFTTFTLFFMTSWGAYHIRYFHNEEGFSTAIDALYEARKDVAFAFESGDVHVFVPERIRKRLRGGEAAVHI